VSDQEAAKEYQGLDHEELVRCIYNNFLRPVLKDMSTLLETDAMLKKCTVTHSFLVTPSFLACLFDFALALAAQPDYRQTLPEFAGLFLGLLKLLKLDTAPSFKS